MVATRVRAPGVSRMRFAMISSIAATGSPSSSATRARKRRRELDLAAHRPLGDGGDVPLESDMRGKLIDAFLADHGGVHVGEQQPPAPVRERLHHHVDRARR